MFGQKQQQLWFWRTDYYYAMMRTMIWGNKSYSILMLFINWWSDCRWWWWSKSQDTTQPPDIIIRMGIKGLLLLFWCQSCTISLSLSPLIQLLSWKKWTPEVIPDIPNLWFSIKNSRQKERFSCCYHYSSSEKKIIISFDHPILFFLIIWWSTVMLKSINTGHHHHFPKTGEGVEGEA